VSGRFVGEAGEALQRRKAEPRLGRAGNDGAGLRASQEALTARQKSAEGIVGQAVGEAGEALQRRKAEPTARPSRERWSKA